MGVEQLPPAVQNTSAMVITADKTMEWRAHEPDDNESRPLNPESGLGGFPGASEYSNNRGRNGGPVHPRPTAGVRDLPSSRRSDHIKALSINELRAFP